MKKLLLEYANTFAYTITGLVFGCAFFLLFINFYHMQELGTTYDVTTFNETNKAEINEKINTIKNNLSVYSQSTYTGDLNIFALNNIQNNLNNKLCQFHHLNLIFCLKLYLKSIYHVIQ